MPKIEGVAYLEGHLKLNKYGTCVYCVVSYNVGPNFGRFVFVLFSLSYYMVRICMMITTSQITNTHTLVVPAHTCTQRCAHRIRPIVY